MRGIRLGRYHTYDDFGLILIKTEHGEVVEKTNYVNIPCGNGSHDFSTALTDGDIKYENRTHKYTFATKARMNQWISLETKIRNAIEGQSLKIIEDLDSAFYWQGRVKVSSITPTGVGGTLTIEVTTTSPYKHENQLYNIWEWDSFEFENGVIREYKELPAGTYEIVGTREWQPLKISVDMDTLKEIKLNGATVWSGSLSLGTHIFPDIIIKPGTHSITILGDSSYFRFSLIYEGGHL